MKPLLSSLEGMTSMFMASQQAPHTAQSIRDIIAQLRSTPMFAGQVEDGEAEELARLIEEKFGISMGLGAIVDAMISAPGCMTRGSTARLAISTGVVIASC